MRFHPDNAEMFGQRQYHPVAKMSIERDQYPFLLSGALENERIIGSSLADFRGSYNLMPACAQKFRQPGAQTLIEIKTHRESGRIKSLNFRVQDGVAGVIQNRLNIRAREFRVAVQNRIPRFACRQLFQNGGNRNPRPLDDGLAAANAWIDLNAVTHTPTLTAPLENRKRHAGHLARRSDDGSSTLRSSAATEDGRGRSPRRKLHIAPPLKCACSPPPLCFHCMVAFPTKG